MKARRSFILGSDEKSPDVKFGSRNSLLDRLRVVSNFGDGDCGAGEIHTRTCEILRRPSSHFWRSRRVPSPRNFARVRVCISPTPQSPSPKLETIHSLPLGTYSLGYFVKTMAAVAKLEGKRTNHSARRTMIATLTHKNVSPLDISQLSEHKNLKSIDMQLFNSL